MQPSCIHTHCSKAAQLELDETYADSATIPSVEPEAETEYSGAESEVSGGVGSTGALDRTEEDFTRESAKITGFMGKNSDVTWLQRLKQENAFDSEPSAGQSEDEPRRNGKSGSLAVPGEILMCRTQNLHVGAT